MKKLSIEEKAKRYDETIERAKSLLSGNQLGNAWIYKLLPELKESEDERIRKQLLKHLREVASGKSLELSTTDYERWATWVEKQGEKGINGKNREIPFSEQNPAWSEEDERIRQNIEKLIRFASPAAHTTKEEALDWLKSLKDRYTWKPTKEQLTELRCVISGCSYDIEPLVELEKELKAL